MDMSRPSEWLRVLAAFFRHDKTREGIGVLAMAAAVLTVASLATFDPRDPSFFSYASAMDPRVRNAVGRVGAELAGDILGLLGVSALLVPSRRSAPKPGQRAQPTSAPCSKVRSSGWATAP